MKKVGSSVSKAVESIVPTEREEERPTRRESRREREDVYRPGALALGAAAAAFAMPQAAACVHG